MYILFIAAFIVIICLDPYIPKDSFLNVENGLYESLQYIILLSGAGLSLKDLLYNPNPHVHTLSQTALPAWLLIQAREINWGRVYYQYNPIYKVTIAYPIVTILILYSLYKIIKHHIFTNIWRLLKNNLLSKYEFFSLFLLAFGHFLGEKIIHSAFIEMSMELFCYANLLLLTYRIRKLFENDDYKYLLK